MVELTLALHRVFDSPRDKIIWDVGHQSYPHKLLTGRFDQFAHAAPARTASPGIPRRAESPHDPFGTSHGSTEHLGRTRLRGRARPARARITTWSR